jgi:hypothetical protein
MGRCVRGSVVTIDEKALERCRHRPSRAATSPLQTRSCGAHVLGVAHRLDAERDDAIEVLDQALGLVSANKVEALDAFGEDRRALDVGEEHGHLLALALDRRPRLSDAVGQVLRRRRGWRADRRCRSAACRTRRGEPRAAIDAEATVGSVVVLAGGTAHRAGHGRQSFDIT